jgi:hypothetical protein
MYNRNHVYIPEHSGLVRSNPLNAELIPICHLLVLLGAHHILHVSRIRVKVEIQLHQCLTLYHNILQSAQGNTGRVCYFSTRGK